MLLEQAINNPPLLTFTVVPWMQVLRLETSPGSSIGNLREVRRSLSISFGVGSKSSFVIARRLRLLLSTAGMIIVPGIKHKPPLLFNRASSDRFCVRMREPEND
jgi:hypothetical protein